MIVVNMKKIFNKKNKSRALNKSKGFTLIEMMVSVSIFVIVALIVSAVLIQLSAAYKKAQAMRLLMDNLNFAIEKMNLEIRGGVGIKREGDSGLRFKELGNPDPYCYSQGEYGGRQTLLKCKANCPCNESSPDVKDMLSPGIEIDTLNFNVTEIDEGNNAIAKVLIMIKGKATSRPNQTTEFMVQTTATQRTSDPE